MTVVRVLWIATSFFKHSFLRAKSVVRQRKSWRMRQAYSVRVFGCTAESLKMLVLYRPKTKEVGGLLDAKHDGDQRRQADHGKSMKGILIVVLFNSECADVW